MAEYCGEGAVNTGATSACPVCGMRGFAVDERTVKALLIEAALQRFEPAEHSFCPDASCAVVYFDRAGRSFTTADVRVGVWQKESPGARTICYCFGEDETRIRTELEQTGASTAVERMRAHIDAGRCACEIRNPKGSCCLGDITQAVQRITENAKRISNR